MQKTIRFPRPIDSESLRQRSDKLANLIQEINSLEEEKKAEVKAYNDQIKMLDSEALFLSREIKEQTELVDVVCDVRKNYDTGMWDYFEAGTDNLLKSEPMSPTDFQADITEQLQLQAPRILNEHNVVEDIQHEAA